MEWLTALVSPRSVAPHPNFRSSDRVTPAGLLGLAVRGEPLDEALESRLEQPLEPAERELIEATTASVGYGTIAEGAERLIQLVARSAGGDPSLAAAAALLASVALAEIDQVDRNIAVLEEALSQTPDRTDDERLCAAFLAQQMAMRSAEAETDYEHARDRARDLISGIDARALARYPTSQGSRWGALATNRRILLALGDANQNLFDWVGGFPDTKTLKRLLRTDSSDLVAAMIRHAGSGSAAYVDEGFAAFTQSTERSVRYQDPVDSPIWQALFFFELIGHRGQARALRAKLGEVRMLRSKGSSELNHEGLRLLRHGGDAKRLKLALNLVRGGGPLDALKWEADAIVERRRSPSLLREVEFLTLESSAQLLDKKRAEAAYRAVLAAFRAGPTTTRFRRGLPATQIETMLKAAAALAPVAGCASEFAEEVLASAIRIGSTQDQLLVRAHEAAIAPLDWNDVSDSVKSDWKGWLATPDADLGRAWESLANLVRPEVRDETFADMQPGTPATADRIAKELNAAMSGGVVGDTTQSWLRGEATRFVIQQLERTRSDASRGVFSHFGHDAADLAVAIAQHAGADPWDALLDYLLDVRIPRGSKSRALDRMAAKPASVPDHARQRIAEHASSLLEARGTASPFDEPEIDPFPPSVRLLAALSLTSAEDQLEAVATLAAGPDTSRLEAARTLRAITANNPAPEWVVAIALQLSSDPKPSVRAEAGWTLAAALENSRFARHVIAARLTDLLAEDGILVPLLVLRGVMSAGGLEAETVVRAVEVMASTHRVFGVRVQARYVLEHREAGAT